MSVVLSVSPLRYTFSVFLAVLDGEGISEAAAHLPEQQSSSLWRCQEEEGSEIRQECWPWFQDPQRSKKYT